MKDSAKKQGGYSLLECLFVLLCIAILSTIAVPNICRLHQEWTLWGGTVSLESSLQWGRMYAISSNTSMIFKVSDDGIRYCWRDASSGSEYKNSCRSLANGLRIESAPKSPVRFYQLGNAVPAGTFVISGNAGSCSVIVSPGGRIRIERK